MVIFLLDGIRTLDSHFRLLGVTIGLNQLTLSEGHLKGDLYHRTVGVPLQGISCDHAAHFVLVNKASAIGVLDTSCTALYICPVDKINETMIFF